MAFALEEFQVFESYSKPDEPLRCFGSAEEVRDAFDSRGGGLSLMIYSPSMNGHFVVERIELKPGAVPGKSWRERISGWGLIQREFSAVRGTRLPPSFTNHNTEIRARAWEQTYPHLQPAQNWDFREVTRLSRCINRRIASIGMRKVGPRPVLAGADALAKAGIILGAA